ncbi:MAG: hypothetical protein RQ760_14460, partial [Sedimentisphaerales bacterium]|nr:hypothetical protein [Sedimentisphaerales bacterium]
MKRSSLSRRRFIAGAGAALSAAITMGPVTAVHGASKTKLPFRYCLNTSTIRGQKLSLEKEIEVTA